MGCCAPEGVAVSSDVETRTREKPTEDKPAMDEKTEEPPQEEEPFTDTLKAIMLQIPNASAIATFDSLTDIPTGSIILMAGSVPASVVIQTGSQSPFSHCCIFVNGSEEPLVFSADQLTTMECKLRKMSDPNHSGTHLVSLKQFMANVKRWVGAPAALGEYVFAVARLRNVEVDEEKLGAIMHELDGIPFPETGIAFFQVIEGVLGVDSGKKSMFCSQAVALVFQRMGWMDADTVPNNIWPRDFDVTHSSAVVPSLLTSPLQLEAPEFFKLSDEDAIAYHMP